MKSRRIGRPVVAGALLLLGAGGASAQRGAPATPLGAIEKGQWQLKSGENERKLCVTDPALLLQITHGTAQCEHFVVEQTARSITMRYTCPGHGHGRTVLGVDTGKSIRIDTQGVLDGSPFSENYEGRRIGSCG
jgi:hypothetical protein